MDASCQTQRNDRLSHQADKSLKMFISKKRPVVVPQSEHLRLSGLLAHKWGNCKFPLPEVDREAFVIGIATHDRAFGVLDTAAVGEISDNDRRIQVQRWLDTNYTDPATELIVLFHARRLMDASDLRPLHSKLDDRINQIANSENMNLQAFEQVDSITGFCDVVSFDFCFESERTRLVDVYSGENETTGITYTVDGKEILLDKWPFSVPEIHDYILGYQQPGYPINLQPVLMEFSIRKMD